MRAWVLHGLVFAAMTAGCRSRPLDRGGQGTLTRDAAVESVGASGGEAGAGAGGLDGGTDAGRLVPLALGQPCGANADCSSGFCVDGVCCTGACVGACKRCDTPGSVGRCISVAAGGAPRTPGGCTMQPQATCWADGTCDGAGACRSWPENTICLPGHCDGDAVVGTMVCDGKGHCTMGPTRICVPYRCDPVTASCRDDCSVDSDCPGSTCGVTGHCAVRPLPASCQRNDQCASGFCSRGTCCDSACTDRCVACDVRGREGTCSPLAGCTADAGTD